MQLSSPHRASGTERSQPRGWRREGWVDSQHCNHSCLSRTAEVPQSRAQLATGQPDPRLRPSTYPAEFSTTQKTVCSWSIVLVESGNWKCLEPSVSMFNVPHLPPEILMEVRGLTGLGSETSRWPQRGPSNPCFTEEEPGVREASGVRVLLWQTGPQAEARPCPSPGAQRATQPWLPRDSRQSPAEASWVLIQFQHSREAGKCRMPQQ